MIAITGAPILANGEWLNDHAILISGQRIVDIVARCDVPASIDADTVQGGYLLPGFIDTQVNGGGGVLLNDDPTVEGIAAIAAAHRRFGTTVLLPTLISDDLSIIARAIAAVDDAIIQNVPGIIGIHIEGPFLNTDKHGIHDARKFRRLDSEAIALLSSLKQGRTLVTLAPELAPVGAIAELVAAGVTVAAGHTLATYADVERAVDEGLSGVTHLFNAMSPLQSRAPGAVGAALDLGLICGIIVDGHHVDPASLRVALRAKGAGEIMLVTDAMPTVGSALTTFTIGGSVITLHEGKLTSTDGTLAGSHLDMASAVRNCVSMMHTSIETSSQMASSTPAAFIGVANDRGQIAPGYFADIVHLDSQLMARATWAAGKKYAS